MCPGLKKAHVFAKGRQQTIVMITNRTEARSVLIWALPYHSKPYSTAWSSQRKIVKHLPSFRLAKFLASRVGLHRNEVEGCRAFLFWARHRLVCDSRPFLPKQDVQRGIASQFWDDTKKEPRRIRTTPSNCGTILSGRPMIESAPA